MKESSFMSIQLLALMSILWPVALSNAGEPKNEATETRIVLRISREFLLKHGLPAIEEVTPVDRCLFGAHVSGRSTTQGQTSINLDIEKVDAVFTLHFKGTTITKTVATHRPVEVYSTGTTIFEAQRAIRFDGLRFTAEPSTIVQSHSTTIDGVATPRGLIGRIAYRRAWDAIQQNGPAADAISLEDNRVRVMASFDRESERLVKELNRVVPLEKTVALLAPETKDWVTHIARTKEYIMISPGPKNAKIPILPKEYLQLRAPMELWIHGQPAVDSTQALLQTWATVNSALDRYRSFSSSSRKPAKVEGIDFSSVGDWWVLKVGADLLGPWLNKMEENSNPKK